DTLKTSEYHCLYLIELARAREGVLPAPSLSKPNFLSIAVLPRSYPVRGLNAQSPELFLGLERGAQLPTRERRVKQCEPLDSPGCLLVLCVAHNYLSFSAPAFKGARSSRDPFPGGLYNQIAPGCRAGICGEKLFRKLITNHQRLLRKALARAP